MFAVYLATLNAWVSLDSVRLVASVSGLNWRRELFSPVTFLVTHPLGGLPPGWVPLALNLFTAICAALSLVLLARSVALLPHDRTHAERVRRSSRSPYLTIRSAWLPPTLAVLICGWQLTFWENAVAATGEMIDLLLFAYLIRCLAEFRLKHKPKWLLRFALVYGLAVANNWAMVAFGPAFIVAIVWMNLQSVSLAALDRELAELRSAGFHAGARLFRIIPSVIDLRLLARLTACWLAGFTVFFLLPFLGSLAVAPRADFWPSLRLILVAYRDHLFYLPRHHVLAAFLVFLTSVVPVLFIGIRWRTPREEQDREINKLIADQALHLVHGFFLALCLWTALDSRFSPRGLKLGYPSLPLYFLSSLSIGYFSGCFLLVFGKLRSHPLVGRFVTASIWLLAITAPGVLLCKNLPAILLNRNGPLAAYAARVRQSLPPGGAVILSEDPFRLMCLEVALAGLGKDAAYLTIDTTSLPQGLPYLQFLERKHPGVKLSRSPTNQLAELAKPAALADRLRDFAKEGTLYYLHPPFSPLLEDFRASPHGLTWQLQPYLTHEPAALRLASAELEQNRTFWRIAEQEQLSGLARRIQFAPPVWPAIVRGFLRRAHVVQEPDREVTAVGALYSVGLDYWGVELQRGHLLAEAAQSFDLAQRLNPANPAAQINLKANKDLQANELTAIQSTQPVEARFWSQALVAFGPVDEANHCFSLGCFFVTNSSYRQAVEQFERVKVLAPDYPGNGVLLAEALLKHRDFPHALAEARAILGTEPRNPGALLVEGLSLFEMAHYRDAIPPLTTLLALQSTNQAARLYRGWSHWKLNQLEDATQDYEAVVQATAGAYPAYYALADIAYRKKEAAAAVRNCELYLGCAPPDLPETRVVKEHLQELKGGQN
jgi:hypothetical protein